MDIEKEMRMVQEQMFNDGLLNILLAAHVQEQEAHGTAEDEQEYQTAKKALSLILSEEQKAALEKAEAPCRENLRYAMQFSFSQGCCAGFRQLYEKDMPEDIFQVYVVEQIMTVPNMSKYTEYYNRRGEIRDAFEKLEGALGGEAKEHIISVDAAWDRRLYGVLHHSFCMGHRYAFSVAGVVSLIGDAAFIGEKLCRTEYLMGFADAG